MDLHEQKNIQINVTFYNEETKKRQDSFAPPNSFQFSVGVDIYIYCLPKLFLIWRLQPFQPPALGNDFLFPNTFTPEPCIHLSMQHTNL